MQAQAKAEKAVKPKPGSPEARKLGCKCPVIDNGHGAGSGREDEKGQPLYWISADCNLHWPRGDKWQDLEPSPKTT